MSFATEINAVQYNAMAKKCAEVQADNATLREQLDLAQRRVHALETVRVEQPRGVRWRFDHGLSPELSDAVQEGVIGHFRSDYSTVDEQEALMFPGQAAIIGKENMASRLLQEAEKMIRHSTFRNERARVTVYRGELIIGALKPKE